MSSIDWKMVFYEIIMSLLAFIRNIIDSVLSLMNSSFPVSRKIIKFDNGVKVRLGKKIAEGGFSFVFEAFDFTTNQKYALKRINCSDSELVRACRAEASVHRLLQHPNLLPLLGMKFDVSSSVSTVCYMLFPFMDVSLREEINKRMILRDDVADSERRPFLEQEVVILFTAIVDGLQAMHDAGLAHRDLKVENIMLIKSKRGRGLMDPVIMDFGSARPLTVKLKDRKTVVNLFEEASTHSTVTYRAPELFEGGCRHGPDEPDMDGRVDVWSLGCVLFAIMYGSSPFEVEFRTDGSVRIVECTHLRVIGDIPFPPPHTEAGNRYSHDIKDLLKWILNIDRSQRPTLDDVSKRMDVLLQKLGAESIIQTRKDKVKSMKFENHDIIINKRQSEMCFV